MYRLCRQNQYDVVHVNGNSTTMAIELAAAKLAGVKVRVAHSHNTTTRHVKANQLLRPFFEMVVNGRIACNQAAGKWLFKSKDFVIIENGIDFDKYKLNQNVRTKIRSKLGISDDKILIGHIGKFNSQKNQEFLIELAEKLDDRYRVILIGNGVNLKKDRLLVEKKAC
ncbi:glycosyltransferase [Limosilactobacillus gastricus]|nr:glycosyltransferase [Limosilactobacillus gastricus]QGF40719.1 glycosyltransferase [Limosilactobacillus gastricus]